jgi:hypothetical protein
LFRKRHAQCEDQYRRAVAAIPGFFEKALHSPIVADRFDALLKSAAEASFVSEAQLKELCSRGITKTISSILEHRLLTAAEESRIAELWSALDPLLNDDVELETLFAKAQILRELADGTTPDRVTVMGPMPLKLRRTESILWIFNNAGSIFDGSTVGEMSKPMFDTWGHYCARSSFRKLPEKPWPHGMKTDIKIGDVVLTNYSIHILSAMGQPARIPIARISGIAPYANAIDVGYGVNANVWTCIPDDPWFLVNALTFLARSMQERSPQDKTVSPAD